MVEKIGNRIRKYREESGMSQKKLGMILGLSDKAISAYESCRTLPPIETLYRISQELDKPLELFISDESEALEVQDRVLRIEKTLSTISQEIAELKNLLKK